MAKTVIALYDRLETARDVVQALDDAGFDRSQINLVANDARGEYATYNAADDGDVSAGEGAAAGAIGGGILGLLVGLGGLVIPGIGPVVAAGPLVGALAGAGIGAATGGLIAGLVDMGVSEEDAHYYAEGIRRGGTLVAVRADDARADEAVAIMNRYNPVDVERSATAWRETGWNRFDEKAEPYATTDLDRDRDFHLYQSDTDTARDTDVAVRRDRDVEGEVTLPVVEEDIDISKRPVQRGGVRVTTHVEEVPVEEQVSLREEHVSVERRPVNRPVSAADMTALEEGTIEVTEMAEEAVVSKEARIVEEVVVRKDVDTRTETIRDTVTRTDVDVEELDSDVDTAVTYADYDTYTDRFRQHFDRTYSNSQYSYEQYTPAYRYGYDLATDERYNTREWNDLEPEARRYWEERNPNTWEQFKDSVRHAWDEARQEVRQHT